MWEKIKDLLPSFGACLGSKSAYIRKHPLDFVVFNAHVSMAELGTIWEGDLNLTKRAYALATLAAVLGDTLYVLHESDVAVAVVAKFFFSPCWFDKKEKKMEEWRLHFLCDSREVQGNFRFQTTP